MLVRRIEYETYPNFTNSRFISTFFSFHCLELLFVVFLLVFASVCYINLLRSEQRSDSIRQLANLSYAHSRSSLNICCECSILFFNIHKDEATLTCQISERYTLLRICF